MRVYGIPGSCSLRVVSLMLVSAALVWGPDISLAQVPVELGARGAGAPGLSQTSTPGERNIPGRYIVKFVAISKQTKHRLLRHRAFTDWRAATSVY